MIFMKQLFEYKTTSMKSIFDTNMLHAKIAENQNSLHSNKLTNIVQ